MKAPAVVFVEPHRVEIRQMELPPVGAGQVGVRTVFSGVSQGTERWVLTGRYGHYDHDYSSYYPCTPGYQAAGVVDRVGPDVAGLSVGDHVFTTGTRFADPDHRYPGPCRGSHAGYLVAQATDVWRLDPTVGLAGASLFHMAGVSRHGVRLTKVAAGELVVVVGLGMIGQMAAQAARQLGARVIATDMITSRGEAATLWSADRVVDGGRESLEDAVRSERPAGADVVIDTSGNGGLFPRWVDLIRREGRIALQGYYPEPIAVDFQPTHVKRAQVVFPGGWDDELNTDLADDLATGALTIEPLVTHRIPYWDAQHAYDLVMEKPEESLGMVLAWQEG